MRISTWQQANTSIQNMLKQQQVLDKTQQQISTGKQLLSPADDPASAAKLLKLSSALRFESQYERNMATAEGKLMLTESIYGHIGTALQRARELVLQSNTGTLVNSDRQTIATELNSIRELMLDYANTQDSQGEFIFSGLNSQTRAFVTTATGVVYQGDQNARHVTIGLDQQIKTNDTGAETFQNIPTADGRFQLSANPRNTGHASVLVSSGYNATVDTYTLEFTQANDNDPVNYTVTGNTSRLVASGEYIPGNEIVFNGVNLKIAATPENGDSYTISPMQTTDVFSVLGDISNLLAQPANDPASKAVLQNTLNQSIGSIDHAMDRFHQLRGQAGDRMRQLEYSMEASTEAQINLERAIGDIEDLDMTEALTRLNLQMTALQAAQQSYVRVQGLSLFNFL